MRIANIHHRIEEPAFQKNINRKDGFVPPKKGDGEIAASLQISDEAQKRFEKEIQHFDRRIALPEYCGIYKTDKAVATAVEGCSKEEQIYVYGIIRQNFLTENTSSLTEEERQANIALGMKKAEYASENFIPEEHREKFLDAMSTIAKLASAGKADQNGNMNYGVAKSRYLGHGSNLVATTNTLDMMRYMDSAAYDEYQKIGAESSNEDRPLNQIKFLTDWYIKSLKDTPKIHEEYEEKSNKYFEKEVKDKELPAHFDGIDISSKESFLAGLRNFMAKQQNFLSGILTFELSNRFWKD
ncbi:MAG: hypothetical protein K2K70_14455 [Lachnospiraceae bacterium]|nr:hypothetical protein [Lachnospiraceae bacterium]